MSSPLLRKWFVFSPFQYTVSVYRGLASMEKSVDHCHISVEELDCKLVLAFHCKQDEEREGERERKTEGEKKERETETEGDRKGKREKVIKRNK